MEADKRRRDAIIELDIRELLEMVYPVYNKEESVMDNLIRFVRDGGKLSRTLFTDNKNIIQYNFSF